MSETSKSTERVTDGAFTVKGAVGFSGQSRSAIYAAMLAGELSYFTKGTRRYIARKDLVAWLSKILKPVGSNRPT